MLSVDKIQPRKHQVYNADEQLAYEYGFNEAKEMCAASLTPNGWLPLNRTGQVRAGDWISFKHGAEMICAKVCEIINQGTDAEEVIYDRRKNYYFITSVALGDSSNHKFIFVLAASI